MEGTVVIKLGGSFLTDKSRPYSVRRKELQDVSDVIARKAKSVAIVHGGGSFGHPVAKKYGLSSRNLSTSGEGVSETREAMRRLNGYVVESLLAAGLKLYVLPAISLVDRLGRERRGTKDILSTLIRLGISPLTYGDVIPYREGFRIISGDTLSYLLCRALNAEKMIFLIDRPGVLRNRNDPSSLLKIVNHEELKRISMNKEEDATGGLDEKLRVAIKIASLGIKTQIISGFDTYALISSLTGGKVLGTEVKP